MSVRVWHHGPSGQAPVEVSSGQGTFQTDSAYVVLTPAPASLYVWTGVTVNQSARAAAIKHATSLLGETVDQEIEVQFEVQAQESDAFASLFAALKYTEPAAAPQPEVVPAAAAGIAAAGTAAAPPAAGKKKKKRTKKKGAGAAGVAVISNAATNDTAPGDDDDDDATPTAAVAATRTTELQPEPEDEPAPQPGPAEAAVIAELQEKLEIEKPSEAAAAEVQVAPEPVVSSPNAAPKAPSPAPKAASPAPAPAAKASSPAPAPKKAATPVASPQVKPTLAAAMPPASPTAASPASITAAKTYLADSAKAWGGVGAAPSSGGAAIAPGAKTFAYEDLKTLRADSGIDMTRKEAYLSDADFTKVFGKDKAAFTAQPAWRQQLQKKEFGLF